MMRQGNTIFTHHNSQTFRLTRRVYFLRGRRSRVRDPEYRKEAQLRPITAITVSKSLHLGEEISRLRNRAPGLCPVLVLNLNNLRSSVRPQRHIFQGGRRAEPLAPLPGAAAAAAATEAAVRYLFTAEGIISPLQRRVRWVDLNYFKDFLYPRRHHCRAELFSLNQLSVKSAVVLLIAERLME